MQDPDMPATNESTNLSIGAKLALGVAGLFVLWLLVSWALSFLVGIVKLAVVAAIVLGVISLLARTVGD